MFYDFTNHICIMLVSRQPLYGNNLVNYGNQDKTKTKLGKQQDNWAIGRLCICVGLQVRTIRMVKAEY